MLHILTPEIFSVPNSIFILWEIFSSFFEPDTKIIFFFGLPVRLVLRWHATSILFFNKRVAHKQISLKYVGLGSTSSMMLENFVFERE